MKKITEFRNEFRFLSNFWHVDVYYQGQRYLTVEHAYQAAKFTDDAIRAQIRMEFYPHIAKRIARDYKYRERVDWHKVNLEIMLDLLRQKFRGGWLQKRLLATGDAEIVEGNDWGDTFWGVCKGKGENHLGKLLMQVREEIRNDPRERARQAKSS